jgi:hypothetical protein
MAAPDLSRFREYLSIPVEDHAARARLGITDKEMDLLHDLLIKKAITREFYYEVRFAKTADFIYAQEGRERAWTIQYIREQLNRTETREYEEGDESVHEFISHKLWPKCVVKERERRGADSRCYEVELVFADGVDVDQLQEEDWAIFEREAIQLAQTHQDNEWVKEVTFLPPEGISYRVVFATAGGKRKARDFPLALQYFPLLKKFARLPLEDTRFDSPNNPADTAQRYSRIEIGEGQLGLWQAVLNYDPETVRHIPGYLEQQVQWHMSEQFDSLSTEAWKDLRPSGEKRVLKKRLERSGGELDTLLSEDDSATEASTLGDRLPAPDPYSVEDSIHLQQIIAAIPDPIDRKIVYGLARDMTQREVALQLGITPSAVNQRVKRLQPIVRRILSQ